MQKSGPGEKGASTTTQTRAYMATVCVDVREAVQGAALGSPRPTKHCSAQSASPLPATQHKRVQKCLSLNRPNNWNRPKRVSIGTCAHDTRPCD